MNAGRGKTTAIMVSSVGIVVLLWSAWSYFELWRRGHPPRITSIAPERGLQGQKVQVFAGPIPVKEFFAFLANYTGRTLLVSDDDGKLGAREITIANDIREADEDLVKAILEVNGLRVFHETLVDGTEILTVEATVRNGPESLPKQHPMQGGS